MMNTTLLRTGTDSKVGGLDNTCMTHSAARIAEVEGLAAELAD